MPKVSTQTPHFATSRGSASASHIEMIRSTPSVTPFQRRVYNHMLSIPAGSITTYGEIARILGTSPRAVGKALRANPFSPVVPCHRVIASDGKLGGFFGQTTAGSKLIEKVKMLKQEGIDVKLDGKGQYMVDGKVLAIRLHREQLLR